MNKLYNKIYEAVNTGIQKALIISDDQSQDTSVKFHKKEISTEFIPYEYRTVDLGLSSGLLWCEYNLGAEPSDIPESWYGDYYSWGETEVKKDYSLESYIHFNKGEDILKYNINDSIYMGNIDNLTQLVPEDDVVINILGKPFRMPNKDEYQELLDNTKHKWVNNYKNIRGLNGMLFTSVNNGKTLFFPATGNFDNTWMLGDGSSGALWSSSLNTDDPNEGFHIGFNNEIIGFSGGARYVGLSVRGVKNN